HALFRTRAAGLAGAAVAGEVDDVFLGHRTAAAGAFHVGRVHAFGDGAEAGARRQRVGRRFGGGRCRGGFGRRSRGGGGLRRFGGSRGRRGGDGAFLDDRHDLAAGDGVAFLELDFLQHAVDRGRHFQHDLVGFQIEQVLVALDGFTHLLVPGGDGAVGDGFGQYRGFDFGGHAWASWFVSIRERGRLFSDLVVERVDQCVGDQLLLLADVVGHVADGGRGRARTAGVVQGLAIG